MAGMRRIREHLGWLLFAAMLLTGVVFAQFQPPATLTYPQTATDIATPANPAAGQTKWYTKAGALCSLNSSGTETCTGSGAGLTQISKQVLGSAAATVTFSSIPATYSSLEVMMTSRGDTSASTINAFLQFNNDTGANYNNYVLISTFAGSVSATASPNVCVFPAANVAANYTGTCRLLIPNYAGTVFNKALFTQAEWFQAPEGVGAIGLSWNSTAAINRIDLKATAGNFVTGTTAVLYGIT